MSYISINIRCWNEECGHVWSDLVEREHQEEGQLCPECGKLGYKTVSAPAVLRASYHSGYRRGESYEQAKQVAKLKSERANMPRTEEARKEINREIGERQRVVNTRRDKSGSKE